MWQWEAILAKMHQNCMRNYFNRGLSLKKILVTGSTGFLGKAIIQKLYELEEYSIRASTRVKYNNLHDSIEISYIDNVSASTDWSAALKDVDVIIHTVARVHVMNETSDDPLIEFRDVNTYGTLNLATQASIAGVKRFIYLSSIKVNGEGTTLHSVFSEADIPAPSDPYGVSKHEAEVSLIKLSQNITMDVVIIRPPLIYGPGVKANFLSMMRLINKRIPLPLGLINNSRSLVAIENVVDLIITCIEHPAASNQVFLVSDGDDMSTTDLCKKMASALGVSVILLPIPQFIIEVSAALIGKKSISDRLCGSLRVDISKAKNMLGWTPPMGVDEALLKTAISYKKSLHK